MEIIGYFIVYGICTLLTKANLVGGEAIGNFIAGAAGGAVEEIMESVVQMIFPNGSFFFTRTLKARQRYFEKIIDDIRNLPSRQQKELFDFIGRLDYSKVAKKEFKEVMELIEGDLSAYFESCNKSHHNLSRTKVNAFQHKTIKLLKELYESIDNELNKTFKEKDINDIVEELFGVKWEDVPNAAKEMFKMLKDQVFELKYLSLSSEDQDLIKIIQNMIDDGNNKLLANLKPSFDYIDQIYSMAGTNTNFKEIKIDSIAKTNPFCYFRLECPSCHASGRNVYKDNENNVHCRACGETFSIIESVRDDEIIQKIDEVYKNMSSQIGKNYSSMEKNLRELAGKIVEVEYFEAFKDSIINNTNKNGEAILRTMEKLANDIENTINNKIEEFAKILPKEKSDEDIAKKEFLNSLTATIASLNQKSEESLTAIHNTIQQTSDDVVAVKTMAISILNSINELQQTSDFLKNVLKVSAKKAATEKRICPRCGRTVTFERKPQENHYVCKCCGYSIDKDMIHQDIKVDDLELRIIKPPNTRTNNLFLEKTDTAVCPTDQNTKVARIHLSPEVAKCLNDLNYRFLIRDNYNLSINTEKVVILGEVNLNPCALELIVELYTQARTIVFGQNVGLKINVDPEVWIPRFGDGSEWKYDQKLHKLSRSDS